MERKPPIELGKCQIVVPQKAAREFRIQNAIDLAMERSLQIGTEVAFFYDPQTKQLTSSIFEGMCYINLPKSWCNLINQNGLFHTHPNDSFGCGPSYSDFQGFFVRGNTLELKLGCPDQNTIVTFHKKDSTDLLSKKATSVSELFEFIALRNTMGIREQWR